MTSLGERFAHQPEFVVLEVAQAAVDQLGGGRRSRRSEVIAFDKQRGEAATGGIARDPSAVDAAADYEQVVGHRAGHYSG